MGPFFELSIFATFEPVENKLLSFCRGQTCGCPSVNICIKLSIVYTFSQTWLIVISFVSVTYFSQSNIFAFFVCESVLVFSFICE